MKCWVISDTHGFHGGLKIPPAIDVILFAGDMANYKESYKNYEECDNFLSWLEVINVRWKLICAGNHDISFEKKMVNMAKFPSIHYLEHESVDIEGINIFMSPFTPSFGVGWAFNRDRSKLDAYWQHIPENTDILVTHGPPKGILDLSHNVKGELEYCGDKALLNHIYRVKPKYSIFGHIHNSAGNYNAGKRTVSDLDTVFINASCVEDGRFDKGLTSHGIVFDI
jgi:Icc-related predicted phosphoesterase